MALTAEVRLNKVMMHGRIWRVSWKSRNPEFCRNSAGIPPEFLRIFKSLFFVNFKAIEEFPKIFRSPNSVRRWSESYRIKPNIPRKQSNCRRCSDGFPINLHVPRRLSNLLRFISMASPCHKGKPCFYNVCVPINNTITRMIDGNFGNVSAGVLFSKVAYQRKRW